LGSDLKGTTTVIRGRVPWEILRQMQAGCMTWEGTAGNGAKTGMTRRSNTACCAVRRGPLSAPTICLLRIAASASLIFVTMMAGFVVLWRLSLRGEAGPFSFCSFTF
jgi:hypothetical protein